MVVNYYENPNLQMVSNNSLPLQYQGNTCKLRPSLLDNYNDYEHCIIKHKTFVLKTIQRKVVGLVEINILFSFYYFSKNAFMGTIIPLKIA